MAREFEKMVNSLEEEILNLKTASQYSSIRSAYSVGTTVRTGLYRITYQDTGEDIFSFVTGTPVSDNNGTVWPRTPTGNNQIVEVNSDAITYPSPTSDIRMTVISNIPVVSITRIS